MKITIECKLLRDIVAQAAVATKPKSSLPFASLVLLETVRDWGEIVRARATDAYVSAQAQASCEIVEQGSLAVEARALRELLGRLGEGEVTLEAEGANVLVRQGRSRFRLLCQDADDFPAIGIKPASAQSCQIPGELLADAIGCALPAADRGIREHLSCVRLLADGSRLTASATDGHRAHVYSVGFGGMLAETLIPMSHAGTVSKMAAQSDEVTLSRDGSRLWVEAPNAAFSTALVDGSFPDLSRVIPSAKEGLALTADRERLAELVYRVAVADAPIALLLDGDELHLQADSAQTSAAEVCELTAVAGKAQPQRIGVNASYLADALKAAGTIDVTLRIGAALDPIVVEALPVAGREFLAVVMPMRV